MGKMETTTSLTIQNSKINAELSISNIMPQDLNQRPRLVV